MSQVELRRGDVVLVSSDGLHGPVTDEEILQILQEEPDLKKACERLVARALEREGPDNITVVRGPVRRRGPARAEAATTWWSSCPTIPGYDPIRAAAACAATWREKVTVEVTVPKEAIRLTGGRRCAGAAAGRCPGAAAARRRPGGPRPARC